MIVWNSQLTAKEATCTFTVEAREELFRLWYISHYCQSKLKGQDSERQLGLGILPPPEKVCLVLEIQWWINWNWNHPKCLLPSAFLHLNARCYLEYQYRLPVPSCCVLLTIAGGSLIHRRCWLICAALSPIILPVASVAPVTSPVPNA